jgi:transposase InsO family protein
LPTTIRVDQGTEFVSRDLDPWAYQRGATLDFSRHRGVPLSASSGLFPLERSMSRGDDNGISVPRISNAKNERSNNAVGWKEQGKARMDRLFSLFDSDRVEQHHGLPLLVKLFR